MFALGANVPRRLIQVSLSALPEAAEQPFDFAETELLPKPCSFQQCSNGHLWPPVLAVTKCPGCGASQLVLKMVNCPYCNEPAQALRLRLDHLPKGGAITPICKGSGSLAEVIAIDIVHDHAASAAAEAPAYEVPSKV